MTGLLLGQMQRVERNLTKELEEPGRSSWDRVELLLSAREVLRAVLYRELAADEDYEHRAVLTEIDKGA